MDLILSAGGPSTDRGLVATLSGGSIVLAAVTVWLVTTFPDPISEPEWGLAVFACAMLCGACGLMVSVLHLRRSESDRLFGVLMSMINVAAMVTPLFWMIAR
jgi:hypothetical protein